MSFSKTEQLNIAHTTYFQMFGKKYHGESWHVNVPQTYAKLSINDTFRSLFPMTSNAWLKDLDHEYENSYHNMIHSLTTCLRTLNLSYSLIPALPTIELQALVIAALYHDYNHSGGRLSEDVNIHRASGLFTPKIAKADAVFPFLKFIDRTDLLCDISLHKPTTSKATKDLIRFSELVRQAIMYTRFPYNENNFDNLPRIAEVLRDVDRLSVLDNTWWEQIYVGLYSEICDQQRLKSLPQEKRTTFEQFCQQQVEFLSNFRYYSELGEREEVRNLVRMKIDLANRALTTVKSINNYIEAVSK